MRLCWRVRFKSLLVLVAAVACLAGLSLVLQRSPRPAVSTPASNYRSVHTHLAPGPTSLQLCSLAPAGTRGRGHRWIFHV